MHTELFITRPLGPISRVTHTYMIGSTRVHIKGYNAYSVYT